MEVYNLITETISQPDRDDSKQSFSFPDYPVSGAELIARSINQVASKDVVVMGVPGSPTTEIIEWLEINGKVDSSWVEMDEVDMLRQLIGANTHGHQTIAVMKHTGFFKIQELLAAITNHDLLAPMVLIVGDEPGASSQNGNDSRFLCDSSYLPVVEPSFNNIPECLSYCIRISSVMRKPVVYRVVPAVTDRRKLLKDSSHSLNMHLFKHKASERDYYASEGMVLGRYARSKTMMRALSFYEHNDNIINQITEVEGTQLVIASGGISDRVQYIINDRYTSLSHLEINTVSNLPEKLLVSLINRFESILILESWEPYLERKLRSLAQRIEGESNTKIFGREPSISKNPIYNVTGNGAGDLSDSEIANIVHAFSEGKEHTSVYDNKNSNHAFSQDTDSRYMKIFEAYKDVSENSGKSPVFSISTGRTRYSVMHSPLERFVKFMPPMGSEAMTLVGYLNYSKESSKLSPCLVIGDYTFVHSSWVGICAINKYRENKDFKIVTIIIDNGGSHTTGGQTCPSPLKFGPTVVTEWSKRFIGKVSINDEDNMRILFEKLQDIETDEDIIIVSVPNKNSGDFNMV